MKLLLVRHAAAVEAAAGKCQNDLARPLTKAGGKAVRRFFKRLDRWMAAPEAIVSSEAVRAVETARLLSKAFGGITTRVDQRLNPGCRWAHARQVIREGGRDCALLALVGHEPDLSAILARLVAGGRLEARLRKGGCALVDLPRPDKGQLLFLLNPKESA